MVAVLSQWLMGMLYGEAYADYYPLVIWQLLSLLLGYTYKTAASFLRAIEVTQPIFISTVAGVFAICLLIVPLGLTLEENGIMLAKVISETVALILLGRSIRRQVTPEFISTF